MNVRAVILAGGEGSRLGVLTAKRAKPAVPFAGKYRIIDFTLSNCVNSGIFDTLILAQYRPQSLIEHIGSGGPWDLNRNFTGGVSIHTPYTARSSSDWYLGTADAVQQNFMFIKRGPPDHVLILSGDHIYSMDYRALIEFHRQKEADLTLASFQVPLSEASRFGTLGIEEDFRVTSFTEKPPDPKSDWVNMGVYLFNTKILDKALWLDRDRNDSSHDFGKDILPGLVAEGKRVYAYPYRGYWVDVGTDVSYWQAHMDLLLVPPSLDLNNRSWIIHTRTEERPPSFVSNGAMLLDCLISDGCQIASTAHVERSILSPGVRIMAGTTVIESIVLTDTLIQSGATVERTILDKRVTVGENARVGNRVGEKPIITMVGKNSHVTPGMVIEPGAMIGSDVIESDYRSSTIRTGAFVQTNRLPYEI